MKKTMSITAKLFLSNVSYIVPVAVLAYFVVAVQNENIKFAAWELKGNAYQKPLEKTFEHLGDHSLLLLSATNDSKKESELVELEKTIDQDIAEIEKINALHGEDLQFTKEGLAQRHREHLTLANLKKEWAEIKGQRHLKTDEFVDKHSHLVADVRGMITHLGDTSNLILDPDLDSYYMMDITLAALPQMQERLLDIAVHLQSFSEKKALTNDDALYLATASAFLKQSDLDRVTGDAQTAINEDKNFYGISESLQQKYPGLTDAYKNKVEELLKDLKSLQEGNSKKSINDVLASANVVYTESFDYWLKSANELDHLLNNRQQTLTSQRNHSVIYSLIALIIAATFATMIGLSIRSGIIMSVSEVIAKMKNIANVVNDSNKKLVLASEQLAVGTNQQASAIQETVSTLDEISSMTQKSASNAQSSASEAKATQVAAIESKNSVQSMVVALKEISASNEDMIRKVSESNDKIFEITNMIHEISEKTKIIDEIVLQTKLLSFNASVEAARAGEFGKGFSVVAEEVGNLAQMSGKASNEINELLSASTKKVTEIIEESKRNMTSIVHNSKIKIDAGMKTAQACERTLSTAVHKVEEVTQLMTEIAVATREQSIGVTEITKAMNQIDQTTQQNSSAAVTTSDLAKQLEEQAAILEQAMHDLENRIGKQKEQEATYVASSLKADIDESESPTHLSA